MPYGDGTGPREGFGGIGRFGRGLCRGFGWLPRVSEDVDCLKRREKWLEESLEAVRQRLLEIEKQ